MESNIKSSFIPKDAANFSSPRQQFGNVTSGIYDLIILFAIVLLVASVALGVGVFIYAQYLDASLSSKKQQLERAQAAFEPALIAELTRLDDRMKAGQLLLERHIAPSIVFNLLEDLTLETVSFSSFGFDATQPEAIKITMQGIAESVNSIALQADLLAKHQTFSSPIFSNINRGKEGVSFDVSADINPVALRYTHLLNSQAAAAPQGFTLPSNVPDFSGRSGGASDVQVSDTDPSGTDEGIPLFAP